MKIDSVIKRLLLLFSLSFLVGVSATETFANGGVTLGGSTRIIFHSDERRVSFPAINETNVPMIFHAQVLSKDKKSFNSDFIVSPEVQEIESGKTVFPQIIKLSGKYPEDRESLIYLEGHFLPAVDKKLNDRTPVHMSYAIHLKVFYRPSHLKASFDAIDDVADKIDFRIVDRKLNIFNKTPYYLTFNYIHTNGKELLLPGDGMLEPFGQIECDFPENSKHSITWTLINDGGFSTKPLTRNL